MIDFREPEMQKILNKMTGNVHDIHDGFKLRVSLIHRNLVIHLFNDKHFYSEDVDYMKTISQTSPFDVTPDVWKRINQPDFIYLYKINIKKSIKPYLKYFNTIVKTVWGKEYNHYFYEQLTDDIFMCGSTMGQE